MIAFKNGEVNRHKLMLYESLTFIRGTVGPI